MKRDPWVPDEELCEKAYAFVRDHIEMMTYPPTLPEIAEAMGWKAPSSALLVVKAMEERGWITRSQDRRRIIRLTRGESNGQG